MFNEIKLTNFKCFRGEVAFPLSKINLLTGINGRGKSSFLQSLLLFKQSVEKDKYTTALYLNGDYVSLETYEDVVNRNTPNIKNTKFYEYEDKVPAIRIQFIVDNVDFNYSIMNYEYDATEVDIHFFKIKNNEKNICDIELYCQVHGYFHNLLPKEEYWEKISKIKKKGKEDNDKNYHPTIKIFSKPFTTFPPTASDHFFGTIKNLQTAF